jgi:diaminopimelate decarboxylase
MSFAYRRGVLCAERVPLDDIARRFGTPCYVYSSASLKAAYEQFTRAAQGRELLVCYSVKASSNLALLALMAGCGAGFDIVSGGELARVLAAGGDPRKTVFSGVGKTDEEIRYALESRLLCLNLESEAELERVNEVALRMATRAPVAFRVNPDVDARTHPYISTGMRENKFGISHQAAERLYARAAAMPGIEVAGIGCHIGSQLSEPAPFLSAVERLVALADRVEALGIPLRHIDVGGGFGIRYNDEAQRPPAEFIAGALRVLGERPHALIVDPGRSIAGNAGVLLTRVEYVKPAEGKNFLVVNAAMNDLIRPALYGAWHDVKPVREPESGTQAAVYDVVGPVCESADFLAKDRLLSGRQGDLLAIMSAGAYGMAMSSNYNTRPRAAEVLVEGESAYLVRRRESIEELFALERVPGRQSE